MKQEFLETGRIAGTHGIHGELRMEVWSNGPESLKKIKTFYFDEGKTAVAVEASRPHKNMLLIKLAGVDTPEQGELLRGKVLWLKREDFPLRPGQYFLQDIMGLLAVDGKTGREYGTLVEVIPTGANDVYRIRNQAGKEFLFPAVPHMIEKIDVEAGKIFVLPIPGIFDGQEESDAH